MASKHNLLYRTASTRSMSHTGLDLNELFAENPGVLKKKKLNKMQLKCAIASQSTPTPYESL